MEIIGDRKYVEIPGERTHELPPLLVRTSPEVTPLEEIVGLAAGIVEDENLVPDLPVHDPAVESLLDRQRLDLALNLTEQYKHLLAHWSWGDSILEWIRQCEMTFESQANLRNLLRPDVWPHAGRASFVTLLTDKAVPTHGVVLENAVGLRLTFRQPPPISCFSDQFLFYLNNSVGTTAYQTWAHLNSGEPASLPPERFKFQVVSMALH